MMSKLDELIQELCPDGVEWKTLKEVCNDFIVPMRDRPKVFDGEIPWCRIEDVEGQFFNRSLSGLGVSPKVVKEMNLKVFPVGTVICSCSASLGTYVINTIPLITNQTFIGIVCSAMIYNKYLLYFMETQTNNLKMVATTGTIPYISRKKFEEIKLPVPPLEVQREIVRILDTFTLHQNELAAELAARKKQYEYYRDSLLTFVENDPSVQWMKLGEAAEIKRGIRVVKKDLHESNGYPVFQNSLTPLGYYTDYNIQGGTTYVIGAGAAGEVGYSYDDFWAADDCYCVLCKDNLISRFVYYFLLKNQSFLFSRVRKASVPRLARSFIENLMIPVPSVSEQQRIVDILDRFDKLCNDISEGLPAEIELRRKQYEYYRDKLLTFTEKEG